MKESKGFEPPPVIIEEESLDVEDPPELGFPKPLKKFENPPPPPPPGLEKPPDGKKEENPPPGLESPPDDPPVGKKEGNPPDMPESPPDDPPVGKKEGNPPCGMGAAVVMAAEMASTATLLVMKSIMDNG